tara:strand:- start:185 stop:433 length:249 start_codon:yes stop_codon:yes gene_type:complete
MKDEEGLWQQLKPTLWQYIEKRHMESMTDDKRPIVMKEWELFIHTFQDAFAHEVSILALDYWNDRYENGMPKGRTYIVEEEE